MTPAEMWQSQNDTGAESQPSVFMPVFLGVIAGTIGTAFIAMMLRNEAKRGKKF